jgi:hypothetical protein
MNIHTNTDKNLYFERILELVYLSCFYFLIFICFFNGWLFSLEFVFLLKKNEQILLVGKFLFLFCLFLEFFFPKKSPGPYIISVFLSQRVLDYCQQKSKWLENACDNFPYLTFLFCSIYIHIFILYWVSCFISTPFIVVSYIYCLCNIIKLVFFPIVILQFIIVHHSYLMVPPLQDVFTIKNVEDIIKGLKKVSELVVTASKKNPKAATALGLASVVGSGFQYQGSRTRDSIDYVSDKIPLMTLDNYKQFANSEEAKELFKVTREIQLQLRKGDFILGYEDFLKWMKNDPRLEEEFVNVVRQTTNFFAENAGIDQEQLWKNVRENALADYQQQQLVTMQGSQVSRSISESNEEITQSAVISKPSVDIPSCIEHYFF